MEATSSLENDLKSIVVSVTNDLSTPIEVKLQSGEWQVVYPQRSCAAEVLEEASVSLVEVRLRESPEVKGSCQAAGGSSLRASDCARPHWSLCAAANARQHDVSPI